MEIALIDLKDLREHEEVEPVYLEKLKNQILKDGAIKRPIIVDKNSNIILDGHFRFNSLKQLGFSKIPAYLVDYNSSEILVKSWNGDVITKEDVIAAGLTGRKFPPKTSKHMIDLIDHEIHISRIMKKVKISLKELEPNGSLLKVANSVLDLIGNTPLVRLNKITKDIDATVLVKLEYFNPGGSIKDRIGISMIEDAERKGLLRPGGTIVEPTSGNTGMGLALVAAIKGYKMIFTIPDKMSQEKIKLLKAFGAKVIITPTAVSPGDPKSYYKVAERIVKETPNSFSPNQYFNPKNPEAHYRTTGPEIWEQTDGNIDVLVAGMGTGGTITGAGRFLKEKNSNVKIVGVDAAGSIFHHEFYGTKGKIHTYKVEGIGEDFIPGTIDLGIIDEIIKVNDKEAFLMTRRLAREEGLLVGGSSGAAVFAALKVAKGLDEDKTVVVMLPDTGRNYMNKIFSDDWLKENKFLN